MDFALYSAMTHDDLLHRLRANAGFATSEQAERALTDTLETLGYLLPTALVRELTAALPRSCIAALQSAIGGGDGARRVAHAHAACIASELPKPTLDEIGVVCGVLFSALPLELIRKLDGELPPPLTGAFTRHAASVAQPAAATAAEDSRAQGVQGPSSHEVLHVAQHGRELEAK